ncbi:MAG: RHS repeat protein [Oscillospiraceae bacterium]|nr:RHS repeat protein [Oscillospiraceae bacterium]MCL2280159.1 RHS repeat protein [Oscillospiraceae bacterium]
MIISTRQMNRSPVCHDALGNITGITDESGITTNYKYDLLGNLVFILL